MKRALVNLLTSIPFAPSAILIDAMPLRLFDSGFPGIPVYYFPFGERKSSSIAAASIIAKVGRDALMTRLDHTFPDFYLGQHKGYSTPLHKKTIKEACAPLIIHREHYLKNLNLFNTVDELPDQQSFS